MTNFDYIICERSLTVIPWHTITNRLHVFGNILLNCQRSKGSLNANKWTLNAALFLKEEATIYVHSSIGLSLKDTYSHQGSRNNHAFTAAVTPVFKFLLRNCDRRLWFRFVRNNYLIRNSD